MIPSAGYDRVKTEVDRQFQGDAPVRNDVSMEMTFVDIHASGEGDDSEGHFRSAAGSSGSSGSSSGITSSPVAVTAAAESTNWPTVNFKIDFALNLFILNFNCKHMRLICRVLKA